MARIRTIKPEFPQEAINRTSGRDKSEIAREVLHKWASEQIDIAMVLDRLMRSEGLPGICNGMSGKIRESKGGQ